MKQLSLVILQFAYVNEQLVEQEERNATLSKMKSKIEHDNETLKCKIAELESTCKKLDQDKQVKDHQLRSLQVHHISYIFLLRCHFSVFFSLSAGQVSLNR